MDISLFRILSNAHGEAVASLEHQYRMNADIMLLSNTIVYNNRLKCGADAVARARLVLPNMVELEVRRLGVGLLIRAMCRESINRYTHTQTHTALWALICITPLCFFYVPGVSFDNTQKALGKDSWILEALRPDRGVCMLDTDPVTAREHDADTGTLNEIECQLVLQLCDALVTAGMIPDDIGNCPLPPLFLFF